MALDRHIDAESEAPAAGQTGQRAIKLTVRPGKPIVAVGRRYSRFVGIMKIALPLAALCLIVLIVAWPALRGQEQPMVEALEKQPDVLQVTGPVLVGTDREDRPYSIAADRANQGPEGPHIVELTQPEGEIAMPGGGRISLNADLGRFDRDSKQLHLMGDVQLFSDDGHRFATEDAYVDMDTQSAWGDQPVQGEGPSGKIEAEGFRIEDNGATVIFTGRSRALLNGAATEPRPTEGTPPAGASNDEN